MTIIMIGSLSVAPLLLNPVNPKSVTLAAAAAATLFSPHLTSPIHCQCGLLCLSLNSTITLSIHFRLFFVSDLIRESVTIDGLNV